MPLKKAFHILFCIYFIALVLVPCGDKDDCYELNHLVIAQATNHDEHSMEICTPFCSCTCCATHFLSNELEPALNIVAVINTVYTVHKESKISSAIISIWQPPKLV